MNSWQPFEHRVYRELKSYPLAGKTLVLGVSGGADSVALLRTCKTLLRPLGCADLRVVHCHHGDGSNQDFRDRSVAFVEALCQSLQVPWALYKNPNPSEQSEEALRNFRQGAFRQAMISMDLNNAVLVLGHHLDDLLETRLLRLVRGTGIQGLRAMEFITQMQGTPTLRPLLQIERTEIEAYLQVLGQDFLRDPSAEDLRSFFRQEWLPFLEQKLPGGRAALARSLELILASAENLDLSRFILGEGLDHCLYMQLSVDQQAQLIASYLSSLGVRNYSRGMVKEICRYLDNPQKVHSFEVAGLRWDIDAKIIRASPLKK